LWNHAKLSRREVTGESCVSEWRRRGSMKVIIEVGGYYLINLPSGREGANWASLEHPSRRYAGRKERWNGKDKNGKEVDGDGRRGIGCLPSVCWWFPFLLHKQASKTACFLVCSLISPTQVPNSLSSVIE
jgi:hypothetical protein